MGIHTGAFTFEGPKKWEGVQLTFKVIKSRKNYQGSLRFGLQSRSLKGYNGNALKFEEMRPLTALPPLNLLQRYAANMHVPIGRRRERSRPRSITANVPIPESHIVFNMNNEPAFKYSAINIADKGFDRGDFLTKRLDTTVLYLENGEGERFQVLKGEQQDTFDVYRVSRLRTPATCDNAYFQLNGSPLPLDQIEVLRESAEWNQLLWGNCTLLVRADPGDPHSKDLRIEQLRSFKFYKRTSDAPFKTH